jgi:hypothetical protein
MYSFRPPHAMEGVAEESTRCDPPRLRNPDKHNLKYLGPVCQWRH